MFCGNQQEQCFLVLNSKRLKIVGRKLEALILQKKSTYLCSNSAKKMKKRYFLSCIRFKMV